MDRADFRVHPQCHPVFSGHSGIIHVERLPSAGRLGYCHLKQSRAAFPNSQLASLLRVQRCPGDRPAGDYSKRQAYTPRVSS